MQPSTIKAYILFSKHEPERLEQVALLQQQFPNAEIIAPVFPKYEKVPFLNKLIQKSMERTGKALLPSEIGVLMSHRKIWQQIVQATKNKNKHYLIFESDSKINDITSILTNYESIEKKYDLFFWGAWNNHVSIKRSTAVKYQQYKLGEPMIKSVYGAYGYSLNAKGAKQMLKSTHQIKYPVDLYKFYAHINNLNIGAIAPELVSTWQTTDSTIRLESELDKLKRKLKIRLFSFRNQIQAYFHLNYYWLRHLKLN
jgi:GR25 family glycosyltransferase involved in LPS biosynthesis